jgi:ABC-2 type transport system permease protein
MGLVLVLFFIAGYVFYSALFAAVGAMVSSEQEAQQALMPIILLLVSSFVFFQPILSKPTSGLAYTLSWLPFSAPIVMPLRMAVIPIPGWEIALAFISVAAGSYIAVWLAARIYRTGMLMYGKRPTLRELGRWIRTAEPRTLGTRHAWHPDRRYIWAACVYSAPTIEMRSESATSSAPGIRVREAFS